jgi:hypothetical protein
MTTMYALFDPRLNWAPGSFIRAYPTREYAEAVAHRAIRRFAKTTIAPCLVVVAVKVAK